MLISFVELDIPSHRRKAQGGGGNHFLKIVFLITCLLLLRIILHSPNPRFLSKGNLLSDFIKNCLQGGRAITSVLARDGINGIYQL